MRERDLKYLVVPRDEVERLKRKVLEEGDQAERARKAGAMRVKDAAEMLHIPAPTLRVWCRSGKMEAMLVKGRNKDRGYWISREEVERLKGN